MNREETKAAIEVMQAYVDGAEIEFANIGEDEWAKKTLHMMWDWVHYRYRIKPKPREFWLAKDGDEYAVTEGGRHGGMVIRTPGKPNRAETIFVREVIE